MGLFACHDVETKFGKQYNSVRLKYGSPIIHDYMKLEISDEDFENWRIPRAIHDTISTGFHAGKGFYINKDSTLQEDDIFRKRIDDTTFAFVAILTFGKVSKNQFTSIYYDSVDEKELTLKATEYLNSDTRHREFHKKDLTIEEADSILSSWGTSRFK
ncbi:hypothetical protein SAMN04488109_0045 [Chryseolinea serpens]|uniref:Uncharacterized protein n=2 Tax=Chryseolinea serpens TaxID=947013 RepID=A0A1M5JGQ6_9BACT|nr:hypothetical protein SAMN04488109_0045 [Chryseolinea serpens]